MLYRYLGSQQPPPLLQPLLLLLMLLLLLLSFSSLTSMMSERGTDRLLVGLKNNQHFPVSRFCLFSAFSSSIIFFIFYVQYPNDYCIEMPMTVFEPVAAWFRKQVPLAQTVPVSCPTVQLLLLFFVLHWYLNSQPLQISNFPWPQW